MPACRKKRRTGGLDSDGPCRISAVATLCMPARSGPDSPVFRQVDVCILTKKEVLLRTGGIPLLFTAPVVQWIEQLSPKE